MLPTSFATKECWTKKRALSTLPSRWPRAGVRRAALAREKHEGHRKPSLRSTWMLGLKRCDIFFGPSSKAGALCFHTGIGGSGNRTGRPLTTRSVRSQTRHHARSEQARRAECGVREDSAEKAYWSALRLVPHLEVPALQSGAAISVCSI